MKGSYDGLEVTAKCGNCGCISYYDGEQFVRGADGKTAVKAGCVSCYALDLKPYHSYTLPFSRIKRSPPVKVKTGRTWRKVYQLEDKGSDSIYLVRAANKIAAWAWLASNEEASVNDVRKSYIISEANINEAK